MQKSTIPIVMPAFRSFLFVVGGFTFSFFSGVPLEENTAYWPLICIVINIVTITVLYFVCRRENLSYRDLIVNSGNKQRLSEIVIVSILMMLVGVGGMISVSFVLYGGLPQFLTLPLPIFWAWVCLLLLPITIVFSEMPLYFGYAYQKLEKSTKKPWLSGMYIIFWYALQHSFFPLIFDERYMLFRFLSFLPLMILLLVLYKRTKNLVPIMIGHGLMDFATAIQILFVSYSL